MKIGFANWLETVSKMSLHESIYLEQMNGDTIANGS